MRGGAPWSSAIAWLAVLVQTFKISQAAALLGVSDDSVRRLVESGKLAAHPDESGRQVIDGPVLARYADSLPTAIEVNFGTGLSARNRLVGIVTEVRSDPVMSQVHLRCGPYLVTSLISTDAVHELGLEPGRLAVAIVKATSVVIETGEAEQGGGR